MRFKLNNLYDPGLHIFADSSEIHQLWGVERRLTQPRKHPSPVVVSDRPWELGREVQAWGSVLRNPETDLLEMYYLVFDNNNANRENPFTEFMCLATSTDGVHWHKPRLGLYEHEGSRDNNIAFKFTPPYEYHFDSFDGQTVIRDEDDPDPQRRYKLFACMQDIRMWAEAHNYKNVSPEQVAQAKAIWGIHYLTSPDGLHWAMPPRPAAVGYGDRHNLARDYRTGEWMLTTFARKLGPKGPGAPGLRSVSIGRSSDLTHWTDWEHVIPLDENDDFGFKYEHHGVYPFNYGSGYLGWMELMPQCNFLVDARLMSSDDSYHWNRVQWERPFLPSGSAGEWDDEWVVLTANPPIEQGDELLLFYSAIRTGRCTPERMNAGIGLARMRLDGFVGLWAGVSMGGMRWGGKGMLPFATSKMVQVVGSELTVNFYPRYIDNIGDARSANLKVQLLDAHMKPIEGFTLAESIPINEDGVRVPVRWQNHPDVASLIGRKVRVHMQWEAGVLFSYRFGE